MIHMHTYIVNKTNASRKSSIVLLTPLEGAASYSLILEGAAWGGGGGGALVPGSTWPRATTLSKPSGAFLREQSSAVMVNSFPRATSFRNMMPVFWEVHTVGRDVGEEHGVNYVELG